MRLENYFSAAKVMPLAAKAGTASGERVLVTGGSGFIGTNLVDFYLGVPGFEILSVDGMPPRDPRHAACYRKGDVKSFGEVDAVLREFQPTIVYHLAARTDLGGRSVEDYPDNTAGGECVIQAIAGLATKPRVTIFASSRMVCKVGHMPESEEDYCPSTAYGASKVRFERIVRTMAARKFAWIMVRPTSIWGPWFGVPYRGFFDAIRHGRYLHPKGRPIRKSFGFVGNTVYQLDGLAYHDTDATVSRMFYLCDYDPVDVYDWATMIARHFRRRKPAQVPRLALRVLAKLGDALESVAGTPAPLTSFRLENLMTEMLHDTNPLSALVGPLPFTLEEGVAITARWMKEEQLGLAERA